jgi:hypothetical protein
MRKVLAAAGLAALLGLSACDSKPGADVAAAPPAPKYVGRMQQMYAGQDQITKVVTGSISAGKDGTLEMQAAGEAAGAGYKNAGFLRRIYAAPPKDGIYEFDVVADAPAGAAAAPTPIDIKGGWQPYPADRLKGVKFIAKTNSVTAMLPVG